jgi:hypothetical protein
MNMEGLIMILGLGVLVLVIALILWALKVAVSIAVILGLVGLVMLIIGAVRRGSSKT